MGHKAINTSKQLVYSSDGKYQADANDFPDLIGQYFAAQKQKHASAHLLAEAVEFANYEGWGKVDSETKKLRHLVLALNDTSFRVDRKTILEMLKRRYSTYLCHKQIKALIASANMKRNEVAA